MKKTEKLTVERIAKNFLVFIKVRFSLPFPKEPYIRPGTERVKLRYALLGGILRTVEWSFITDVLEQPNGPIFSGQAISRRKSLKM